MKEKKPTTPKKAPKNTEKKRRKTLPPLFKTLDGRLRVTVLFAVLCMSLATAYGLVSAREGQLTDAGAANERLLASIVSGTELTQRLPDDAVMGGLDAEGAPALDLRDPNPDGHAELLRDLALEGHVASTVLVGPDNVPRIYSVMPLTGQIPAASYVYLGVPSSAAFSASDAAWLRVMLIGGMLVLAAVWFALVVGDFLITRRVRRLTHAMRSYVDGDESAVVGVTDGLGEFDGITGIFRRLAQRLDESQRTFDDRVRSRTSTLELTKGMTELEKARMQALLESITDGVVAIDDEGRISFLNDIAKEGLWWETDDPTDVPVHQAFNLEREDGTPVPQDEWPHLSTLKDGKPVTTPSPVHPLQLRRRDKSVFPVKMVVTPVFLGEHVSGVLLVFRDVTDEVEFDRRKSEFIAVASHQLRSPISALKWLTDMLRKGDLGPLAEKQQEWVDKIFVSAEKMNILVNELLNVSRMEAGITELNIAPNDAKAYVSGIMAEEEPLLAEKKQTYAYQEQDLPQVDMDVLMMGEVLKNFISNASKYSPEESQVGISATVEDGMFTVRVKDAGIGIPKADQKQMFNKFFRAQNAVESPNKGTGLGLFMAKQTVELHGGEIGFDSEGEGKGSTFWFKLPVKNGEANKKDEPSVEGAAPKTDAEPEEKNEEK